LIHHADPFDASDAFGKLKPAVASPSPETLKGFVMRRPETHLSRYTSLHRTAARKGYRLTYNAGTWLLTVEATGELAPAGSTLDDIAAFLMTQQLSG
jgi:hypothetical protein